MPGYKVRKDKSGQFEECRADGHYFYYLLFHHVFWDIKIGRAGCGLAVGAGHSLVILIKMIESIRYAVKGIVKVMVSIVSTLSLRENLN